MSKRTSPEKVTAPSAVPSDNSPSLDTGAAVDLASRQVGWSPAQGRRFDMVQHNAPDLADRVVKGELKVAAAYARARERVGKLKKRGGRPGLPGPKPRPSVVTRFHNVARALLPRLHDGDLGLDETERTKLRKVIEKLEIATRPPTDRDPMPGVGAQA